MSLFTILDAIQQYAGYAIGCGVLILSLFILSIYFKRHE